MFALFEVNVSRAVSLLVSIHIVVELMTCWDASVLFSLREYRCWLSDVFS